MADMCGVVPQLRDPEFVQQSEWQQFRHWVHGADSKPPLLSDVVAGAAAVKPAAAAAAAVTAAAGGATASAAVD
jgi:hypothetical protein